MVTKLRKITTKEGEIMAFLTIEDKTGSTDTIHIPKSIYRIERIIKRKYSDVDSGENK